MLRAGLSILAVIGLLAGCSHKSLIGENPSAQHFVDFARDALAKIPGRVQQGLLVHADRDNKRDLVLLTRSRDGGQKLHVMLHKGNGRFTSVKNPNMDKAARRGIQFIGSGDLNGDQVYDLVLLLKGKGGPQARLFLNNRKGYFFRKQKMRPLPRLRRGIERVDLIDIDHDGDKDLFFTGRKVLSDGGGVSPYQAQLFINDGEAGFVDLTKVLLPRLRPGIVGTVFADYDGDSVIDLFLVYENRQNALLINNGLGKFHDVSELSLPKILGRSSHADWADFDNDKDNDLLVVTQGIESKYREYPSEFCYILENNGKGRFKKRSLRVLPNLPSHRVFMLDADGNKTVDIIILTKNGPHFFNGIGKWAFSQETRARIPYKGLVTDLSFGDVTGDGFLDAYALTAKHRTGRLWITSFD